jgi:hypothetical protein
MGRNSLITGTAVVLAVALSGCGSKDDGGPTKQQFESKIHHGIDVTKMTEREISALPKPAQDAVRAQIAEKARAAAAPK